MTGLFAGNYNIGIGHTLGFLKKDPLGDELTFAYTYENSGTHGFLHTDFGAHGERRRDEELRDSEDKSGDWLYMAANGHY